MNEDHFRKNKGILYVSMTAIAIIFLYPLLFTGFGCGDDILNYVTTLLHDQGKNARWLAQHAGRFYFVFMFPIHNLPYVGNSMLITKLFHMVPLICSFLLFALILFKISRSKEFAFLFLLLALSLSQISGHTSLFVTYPFFFTVSFSLLLLSFLLLLKYLEGRERHFLFWSVVVFALGLLFYEAYILYLLFVFLYVLFVVFSEERHATHRGKEAFLVLWPYFSTGIIYLIIYFSYRAVHPSAYDGTTFARAGFRLTDFFQVLWKLSYTAFPLTVMDSVRTLLTEKSELIQGYSPVVLKILLNARVEWIVKGILTGICGYILLMNVDRQGRKFLAGGTIMAILLIFVPHLPLAMTSKYIHYTTCGMIGYVTTFFSLFGVILLATLIIVAVINLFNASGTVKKIAAIGLVIFLFCCSVMTDLTNYTVARDIHSANTKFNAIDELIRSDRFREIPQGSLFYAGDLWSNPSFSASNLTEQSFSYSLYIRAKSNIRQDLYRDMKEFREAAMADTTKQLWWINLKQAAKTDDLFMAIGRIQRYSLKEPLLRPVSDNALVVYYSSYKQFSVSFRCMPDSPEKMIPFRINSFRDSISAGETVTFSIFNSNQSQPATIFPIEARGIDLKSIRINNILDPEAKAVYP